MYGHTYRSVLHQCGCGQWYSLPIEATYQTQGHLVEISYPCAVCRKRVANAICASGQTTQLLPVVRTPPPAWLPILKAVVSAECPLCGVAINLADTVANDPEASARERIAAEEFSNGVAVAGGIGLLFLGLSLLAGQSRPA